MLRRQGYVAFCGWREACVSLLRSTRSGHRFHDARNCAAPIGLAGNDACVFAAAFDIHLLALAQVRVGRLRYRNQDAIGGADDDLLALDRLVVALLNRVPGDGAANRAEHHRDVASGAAADQAAELMEVLQATGRRKQVGSATAFNQEMLDTLGGPTSPAALGTGLVKSLGTLVTGAGDAVRRSSLRGNIETLADLFIDPQSVDLIYEAMQRGARPNFNEAAQRSVLQSGSTLFDPRGAR